MEKLILNVYDDDNTLISWYLLQKVEDIDNECENPISEDEIEIDGEECEFIYYTDHFYIEYNSQLFLLKNNPKTFEDECFQLYENTFQYNISLLEKEQYIRMKKLLTLKSKMNGSK